VPVEHHGEPPNGAGYTAKSTMYLRRRLAGYPFLRSARLA
jgi:hypothetical protein